MKYLNTGTLCPYAIAEWFYLILSDFFEHIRPQSIPILVCSKCVFSSPIRTYWKRRFSTLGVGFGIGIYNVVNVSKTFKLFYVMGKVLSGKSYLIRFSKIKFNVLYCNKALYKRCIVFLVSL